jgi:phenylpropionate dioxygenase-like ring-hydroxylating dioxygenase large terminal subunit
VVIENSLEGYHVPAVHSKTFLVADGMGKSETAPVFNVSDPLHSHLIHDADQAWVKRFSRIERQIGKWPWRFENYTHHHIFPNLTVTSFMGYSVHVQLFHPLAADQTEVYSQTIGVKFEEASPAGAKMIEKIYQDGHSFTRKIFAEDGEICQEIQAGIKQAFKLPVFGLGLEERVQHFHQAYSSIIKYNG